MGFDTDIITGPLASVDDNQQMANNAIWLAWLRAKNDVNYKNDRKVPEHIRKMLTDLLTDYGGI